MRSGTEHWPQNSSTRVHANTRRPRLGRWHVLAIIGTTLLFAVATVTVTAEKANELLRIRDHRAPSASLVAAPAHPDYPASALPSADVDPTCVAWPAAKRDIDAASVLPAGWFWRAPERTADVTKLVTGVGRELDRFDAQIVRSDPPAVTTAAFHYTSAKRAELIALARRTFDDAVAAAVTASRSRLNHACGIPDKGSV